jgi:predicted component of type VI protein secretion system
MKTSKIELFVAGFGSVMLSAGASFVPALAQITTVPTVAAPSVEFVPGSTPTVIAEPAILQQSVIIAPVPARVCSEGNNVELRTGPNQIFPVVASLMPGVPLGVQRNQINRLGRQWSFVFAGGFEGFIPSGHVCY